MAEWQGCALYPLEVQGSQCLDVTHRPTHPPTQNPPSHYRSMLMHCCPTFSCIGGCLLLRWQDISHTHEEKLAQCTQWNTLGLDPRASSNTPPLSMLLTTRVSTQCGFKPLQNPHSYPIKISPVSFWPPNPSNQKPIFGGGLGVGLHITPTMRPSRPRSHSTVFLLHERPNQWQGLGSYLWVPRPTLHGSPPIENCYLVSDHHGLAGKSPFFSDTCRPLHRSSFPPVPKGTHTHRMDANLCPKPFLQCHQMMTQGLPRDDH